MNYEKLAFTDSVKKLQQLHGSRNSYARMEDRIIELFELIDPATYDHKSDRMVVFLIQGFSWNCPQHITARYTIEEIGQAFQERNLYVKRLEDEVEELRARLGIVSNE